MAVARGPSQSQTASRARASQKSLGGERRWGGQSCRAPRCAQACTCTHDPSHLSSCGMKTPSHRIPSRFTCDGGGGRWLSSETGVQVRGALLLLPALDTLKLYIADDRGTGSGGCSCAATRVATRAAGSPCLVSETRAGWTPSQSMTGDVAAALELSLKNLGVDYGKNSHYIPIHSNFVSSF